MGKYPSTGKAKRYLMLPLPQNLPRNFRNLFLVLILVLGSNLLTHWLMNDNVTARPENMTPAEGSELYLMDKARLFVEEEGRFEKKVRDISEMLEVPAEWLMAVMYAESKFDPTVANYKGSGAVGLIQFMPGTALELDVSSERLRRMSALQQLEYVFLYLQNVRDRYGNFSSLTDLYLGILYPKAIGQDYCYTLFGKPSQSYDQNSGLDEDKDGRITVSDIDRRLKRLFPTAYMTEKDV
ncbi:MAG: transglycosylase SLT domain-containing protein [Bacteroidia bacterium]|nr:transglycosylase SLT domain-containing protein [Bacteroidia bacterium]